MIEKGTALTAALETLLSNGVMTVMFLLFVVIVWVKTRAAGPTLLAAAAGIVILVVARNPASLSEDVEKDLLSRSEVPALVVREDAAGGSGWSS